MSTNQTAPQAIQNSADPWSPFFDRFQLEKMRRKMENNSGGFLQTSVNPKESEWARGMFPHIGGRLVAISEPHYDIPAEDVTVVGGWCALRMADVRNMRGGFLSDPATGAMRRYTTVQEVADWLKNAVAIDQIIDAIGPYNGSNYLIISEQALWTDRIVRTVSEFLGQELDQEAKTQISDALGIAESKRHCLLQRYLELLTGEKTTVRMFVDQDFYDQVCAIRDKVFIDAGISLEQLQEMFPDAKGLGTVSLVWTTYTGEFLSWLQKNHFVETPKAIFVEPWQHATAESAAGLVFNGKVFSGGNALFQPGGKQEHVGYAGFVGSTFENGKETRQELPLGAVPNVLNHVQYTQWLRSLPADGLDPTNNPLFVWGINTLFSHNTPSPIQGMVTNHRDFKINKKQISNAAPRQLPGSEWGLITGLKETHLAVMRQHAEELGEHLHSALAWVFEGRTRSPIAARSTPESVLQREHGFGRLQ